MNNSINDEFYQLINRVGDVIIQLEEFLRKMDNMGYNRNVVINEIKIYLQRKSKMI